MTDVEAMIFPPAVKLSYADSMHVRPPMFPNPRSPAANRRGVAREGKPDLRPGGHGHAGSRTEPKRRQAVDINAVRHVHARQPLTLELITGLNSGADMAQVAREAAAIGYAVATDLTPD
ncbi:hypothetical protein [Streptomyces sp. NPDC048357]|uniref:hypothetical protein n=1 Tax=Streptomyces sp. NPDC048357 TaxID=3154719 RepID=UPI003449A320